MSHFYPQTTDSTRLFYSYDLGQPEKPLLVFCYGLVCSSLHWKYQLKFFQSLGYSTLWMDYRGHHQSETPHDLTSINLNQIALDHLELFKQLNLQQQPMIVCGHSMGVNVVLEIYKLNQQLSTPFQIQKLILASGTASRPLDDLLNMNSSKFGFEIFSQIEKRYPDQVAALWKKGGANLLAKKFIKQIGFNPHLASDHDIDTYVEQVSTIAPKVFLQLIKDYETYDARPWLQSILIPTLILSGENDHVIPPRHQELMHQLIHQSQFVRVKHGSHCPQMDLPDFVNLTLKNFIQQNLSKV